MIKVYIFYKTIYLKDGRYYYGSHYGYIDDNYRGSNKVIKSIIKKHGISLLIRENLKFFDNEFEMYEFESRFLKLYNLDKDPICLNFTTNAKGWDTWSHMSEEERMERKRKLSEKLSGSGNGNYGRNFTQSHLKKMSESRMGIPIHSDEHKKRTSERIKKEWDDGKRTNILIEYCNNRKGMLQSEEAKKSISDGLKNSKKYKDGRKKAAETKRKRFIERLDNFRELYNSGCTQDYIMEKFNQKISTYMKYKYLIINENKKQG